MAIRIYNTLTKKKEIFEPVASGQVKIYVCGPTVYDSCHVGHARSVVVFDVVVRYLRAINYQVTYIRNFTDVDDKIINRANEVGMDAHQLAEKYIREFHRDMDALNVVRADQEPKVTEHIDDIIAIVKTLVDKKAAYQANGDVFYAVETFADYGKLSGRKLVTWWPGVGLKSMKTNATRLISSCGKLPNRVNHHGRAPGVRGGRDGISNARP
jgi:cysteinyl-tRNA synthetase